MDTIFYRGQHERLVRVPGDDTKPPAERFIAHGDPTWVGIVNRLRAGEETVEPDGGPRMLVNVTPPPEFHYTHSHHLASNLPANADRPELDVCRNGHFWEDDPIGLVICAQCGVRYDEYI